MFRSVFGLTAQTDLKPDATDHTHVNGGEQEAPQQTTRRPSNPMKKGRKKLSSMMTRLHVSRKKPADAANKMDSQSDEDWHSSEDGGEADSYSTTEVASDELVEVTGSEHNKARRRSRQRRRSSVKPHDDRKFILPEEECDIPTFLHTKNCSAHLLDDTRRLLRERYAKNPESFYESDYQRMLADDWTVTRFLLRRRLDPKRTAKLMEECGKFRKTYKMSELQPCDFPREFHQAGGLFKYAPDRVGNVTMYMRIKMYRRVPEISDLFKAFILCVLEQCDVANGGRGTAVVFDLSGCGLQNVDLGFLSWLLTSFRNYCPKGVSYILVLNLPWILNATCKLAMTWMSQSNRRALRFVQGSSIEEFIAVENLPDYLGGTCKINYREVPAGSRPAIETCHKFDLTQKQALKIKELFKEYLTDVDEPEEPAAQRPNSNQPDELSNGADESNSGKLGFVTQASPT